MSERPKPELTACAADEDLRGPYDKETADAVAAILRRIGESPEREGLQRTPQRVARALEYMTRGYRQDVDEILNGALFTLEYDEMVIVKDIDFYSLCEHHMLPFFGKCHIAYLPSRHVIGLSKLPKIVDAFSRRLQIQERLTCQIAETIQKKIKPKGVAVVIEAQHLCMMMRGCEKQNAWAITSSLLGRFRRDARTRAEFLELIRPGRGRSGT